MENALSRKDCLAAEGLYDRLMDEAEKEGLYGIHTYESELVEHCPERVLKLCLDNLERDHRYPGSTRKGYRQFAQHLLHINALPGGEGPVAAIVAQMLKQYPNRPALRDELSLV